MGEVYKAVDETLERSVALKILPSELTGQAERIRRFTQEARAASALNHPHIVHVYDVGLATPEGGAPIHYIAMEYVEGTTLSDLIHGSGAPLRRLILLLAQVADGLAKAHAAGIVHRDLKPDNILVSTDGYAKIVDFGLAKLMSQEEISSTETTQARPLTSDGMMLGTVGYIAPEQIEGRPVDHRADLFAFGCILYEAVTRQRAFQDSSKFNTLQRILRQNPLPVTEVDPAAPPALAHVVERCLAKDPEERYQSAKDLAIELRQIHAATGSDSGVARPTRHSKSWRPVVITTAAVMAIALAIAFGTLATRNRAERQRAVNTPVEISKITNTGNVAFATISPDGKYIAYVRTDGLKRSIRLQHLTTRSDVEIVPDRGVPADNAIQYLSFSPDGAYVYFTTPRGGGFSVLERVPVLGGVPSEVIADVDGGAGFSPDGKRMVFVRGAEGKSHLVVANADGSGAEEVFTVSRPSWIRAVQPAWSPDGNAIFFSVGPAPDRPTLFDVRTKTIRQGERVVAFMSLAWVPGGQKLLAVAIKPGERARQFWSIDRETLALTRLTSGIEDYSELSISADGKTVVSTVLRRRGTLWRTSLDGRTPDAPILSGSVVRGSGGLTALPGGRIAYTSDENRVMDVRVCDPDGSNGRVIAAADDAVHQWPAFGGSRLAVQKWPRHGAAAIRLFDLDSGVERPMATLQKLEVVWPQLSRDGQWLYFTRRDDSGLWKVAVDGGEPALALREECANHAPSPDGKLVACFHKGKVAVFDLANREVVRTYDPPSLKVPIRWTSDSRFLLLAEHRGNVSNVWQHPLGSGAPRQLTQFADETIWFFDISADGKTIISSRGGIESDAVLLRGLE